MALRGAGRYDGASDAFEAMLVKMSELSDPEIRGECSYMQVFTC